MEQVFDVPAISPNASVHVEFELGPVTGECRVGMWQGKEKAWEALQGVHAGALSHIGVLTHVYICVCMRRFLASKGRNLREFGASSPGR